MLLLRINCILAAARSFSLFIVVSLSLLIYRFFLQISLRLEIEKVLSSLDEISSSDRSADLSDVDPSAVDGVERGSRPTGSPRAHSRSKSMGAPSAHSSMSN